MSFLLAEEYTDDYFRSQVERYVRNTAFTRRRRQNLQALIGEVGGRDVLDVGTGAGMVACDLARAGARVTATDPSPVAMETTRLLASELGLAHRMTFHQVPAEAVPVAADSQDLVVAADVTEHLDEATLDAVLAEAMRVLRPGGAVVVYTPCPTHLFERLKSQNLLIEDDPTHIGLRSLGDLEAAARRAGFTVQEAYYRPSHLPLFRWVEMALAPLPFVGPLFRRRICLRATAPSDGAEARP